MNIIISSKQFQLNQTHKDYIEKKMQHLLTFDKTIKQIRVECDADKKEREGKKFRIEVWISGNISYKAGIQAATLYEAVDEVVVVLKQMISKKVKKLRDSHRPSRI